MFLEPGSVCQLINLGWNVTYGVACISFWCFHRSIRIHDSGHVEVVDSRDRHSPPSLHDQIWREAIDLLGIALARLEFNPFRASWAYPLGASRAAVGSNVAIVHSSGKPSLQAIR